MNDLELLRQSASTSALLFDFDGTLSPTVPDPEQAQADDGLVDRLVALDQRYRTVAVISGRPVAFLVARLPDTLLLSGQYGLESVTDGQTTVRSGAEGWRDVVADAARRVEAETEANDGVWVEPKGLSLTVHYRHAPDAEPLVRSVIDALTETTGLVAHDAKQSVELRIPVAADKGSVVRELAEGAGGVLFAGDDLGDLPAMQAVAELRSAGMIGVSVAVDSPELPDAVRAAADVVVAGQDGLRDLLDEMLAT